MFKFSTADRIVSERTGGGRQAETYAEPTTVITISREERKDKSTGEMVDIPLSANMRFYNLDPMVPGQSAYIVVFAQSGYLGLAVLDPDKHPLEYTDAGNIKTSHLPFDGVFIAQASDTLDYLTKQWGKGHANRFMQEFDMGRGGKQAVTMERSDESAPERLQGHCAFWIAQVRDAR